MMKPLNAVQLIICLFISSYVLRSCTKDQPDTQSPLSESIQGAWRGTFGPRAYYLFSCGHLEQKIIVAGAEVYCNEYVYRTEGNQMMLTDILDGSQHQWRVEITSDTTATIAEGAIMVYIERTP